MKRILSIIFAILSLAACSRPESMLVINGSISDEFDGRLMYFCPQPKPTAEIVDSTIIKEGRFRFNIPADSVYVADLRLALSARGNVERLLIVVEPGILDVTMGYTSSSCGTALNDSLQCWKEFIAANMVGSGNDFQEFSKKFEERTVSLIGSNINPLGGFLFMMFGAGFNDTNRQKLLDFGIEEFIPDVSTRRK